MESLKSAWLRLSRLLTRIDDKQHKPTNFSLPTKASYQTKQLPASALRTPYPWSWLLVITRAK